MNPYESPPPVRVRWKWEERTKVESDRVFRWLVFVMSMAEAAGFIWPIIAFPKNPTCVVVVWAGMFLFLFVAAVAIAIISVYRRVPDTE